MALTRMACTAYVCLARPDTPLRGLRHLATQPWPDALDALSGRRAVLRLLPRAGGSGAAHPSAE